MHAKLPIMLELKEGNLVADSAQEKDTSTSAQGFPSPDTTATFTSQFVSQLQAIEAVDVTPDEQAAIAALPSGSALLIVRRGPNMGARFLLDADITTAGRHPDADIFLDDVTVSRRHAEFRRNGTAFEVRDLASLNGTYRENERIERSPLTDADEVQVGKYRLTFFASRVDLARNSSL
jgi:pSer/pThr/pTyr-binding forkhead associated (FHA) protein